MTLTLVLIAIGALLFLVIIYNIIQQYRQKQEAEKRALLLKQKNIISETDELLLNASQLPYSKALMLILHNRIHACLQIMQQNDPRNSQVETRIGNIREQLTQLKDHYQMESEGLKPPESDQHAIHLLQVVKRLRAVLRAEHNKRKVGTQTFIHEDRRLELIQLKINLSNLIKRARMAFENRENALARQMLEKGLKVLEPLPDKDEQLKRIEETLQARLDELTNKQSKVQQEQQEREEQQESSELDMLFQPKRKW
ncbi:DNA repair ATPase [Zobellella endophytica]|uniref:DNA repair ATPase n=1 Tax=Zobellella endophytica TaxID=2116700 RepID=A0A2P7RCJ5_9GAMM|nr:DNA repair ATPase [Zobellella endophytica]PSJ47958.1 DNA repair ATPase [Zobellella endophytica]